MNTSELNTIQENENPKSKKELKKEAKENTPYKRRRWRGDRSDGRKVRTSSPMLKFTPYIMSRRSDATNTYADSFDVTAVDQFCRKKVKEGYTNFGFLHIILAAYIRTVSQRPGINRFVSGQKIYSRNNILVNMTIKREMAIDAPDTMVKIEFEPTDTLDEVYEKFNTTVENALAQSSDDSGIDTVAKLAVILIETQLNLLNSFK